MVIQLRTTEIRERVTNWTPAKISIKFKLQAALCFELFQQGVNDQGPPEAEKDQDKNEKNDKAGVPVTYWPAVRRREGPRKRVSAWRGVTNRVGTRRVGSRRVGSRRRRRVVWAGDLMGIIGRVRVTRLSCFRILAETLSFIKFSC